MMKTCTITFAAFLQLFVASSYAQNAPFDSGSDGRDGALLVTADRTLQIPEDGIFRFTTVQVERGATLSFHKNAANTPVYILAQSNVVVSGIIDVSGAAPTRQPGFRSSGGPGGFDSGACPPDASQTSTGSGPGAPTGLGFANFGFGDRAYGNPLLIPLIGGSGGGGANGISGSGGGGAILIASNTRIVIDGEIRAFAIYDRVAMMGSGGAIRLVAPRVRGSGRMYATGLLDFTSVRTTDDVFGDPQHHGRIRIDTMFQFDPNDPAQTVFTLFGNSVGQKSIGSTLVVLPALPQLLFTSVASREITASDTSPVMVELPVGSNPTQNITIRAVGFTGIVPIRIRLIPDFGPATDYDTEIDATGGNPVTKSITGTFAVNQVVRVCAWTR